MLLQMALVHLVHSFLRLSNIPLGVYTHTHTHTEYLLYSSVEGQLAFFHVLAFEVFIEA